MTMKSTAEAMVASCNATSRLYSGNVINVVIAIVLASLGPMAIESIIAIMGTEKKDTRTKLDSLIRSGMVTNGSSGFELTDKGKDLVSVYNGKASTSGVKKLLAAITGTPPEYQMVLLVAAVYLGNNTVEKLGALQWLRRGLVPTLNRCVVGGLIETDSKGKLVATAGGKQYLKLLDKFIS